MTQKIQISKIAKTSTLAGRMAGLAARPLFEEEARKVPEGTVLLLDMTDVDILTSSYFLASLWMVFWDSSLVEEQDLYPMLYSVPPDSLKDAEIVFEAKGMPALFAEGPEDGLEIRLFNLDDTARSTLRLLKGFGEATATELHKADRSIGKTGWSNRLALLHRQRILRRQKVGRQLIYSPCWS